MTYANAICAKGATLGAKVRPKEHIDARFVRRRAYGGGPVYCIFLRRYAVRACQSRKIKTYRSLVFCKNTGLNYYACTAAGGGGT